MLNALKNAGTRDREVGMPQSLPEFEMVYHDRDLSVVQVVLVTWLGKVCHQCRQLLQLLGMMIVRAQSWYGGWEGRSCTNRVGAGTLMTCLASDVVPFSSLRRHCHLRRCGLEAHLVRHMLILLFPTKYGTTPRRLRMFCGVSI
jgi:hypothetical protein